MGELQHLEENLFEAERFWKDILKDNDYYLNSETLPILADKRIIETVRKYDKDGRIAFLVALIAYNLKNKDAVARIVDTIRKYDEIEAALILFSVGLATYSLKDKDVVMIVDTIRKYEDAWKIVRRLVSPGYLKDSNKMGRLIAMLNVVGKSMFQLLSNDELDEILSLNLDKLVKNVKSFDAVATYIESGKELLKPTEENINEYESLALDCVKTRYDLAKDITMEQLCMLFAIEKGDRERAVELVNRSQEENEKYYSLKIGRDLSLNYTQDELLKYSVLAVVGSRDKELEKLATEAIANIVGEKAVNKARNSFRSNYKHLLKEIIAKVKENNWREASNRLKQTREESILDVLNAAEYRDVNIKRANFIKAAESNNPLDYDSRMQLACVYLPSGIMKKNVLEYCKDKRFVLVKYDIGDKTLGSAICFMEGGNFLVDSVEGHRSFRKPSIFEIVYQDLIERAKEKKAERVIFNKKVTNQTPKEFINYLGGKKLPERRVEMNLNTNGYLEAEEKVKGYIVELGYGKI